MDPKSGGMRMTKDSEREEVASHKRSWAARVAFGLAFASMVVLAAACGDDGGDGDEDDDGSSGGGDCTSLCTEAQAGDCTRVTGNCGNFCDALDSAAPAG